MQKIVISDSQTIRLTKPGEYLVVLAQPDISVTITGRFQATKSQKKNIAVTIQHSAPRTVCSTSLRGTSADSALVRFFGRIIIDSGCAQSNSFLEERILLLSPNARGEAVPELEILTDDVKCSHAASLSTIDAQQAFYLQSRGLTEAQAQKLLVESFLQY